MAALLPWQMVLGAPHRVDLHYPLKRARLDPRIFHLSFRCYSSRRRTRPVHVVSAHCRAKTTGVGKDDVWKDHEIEVDIKGRLPTALIHFNLYAPRGITGFHVTFQLATRKIELLIPFDYEEALGPSPTQPIRELVDASTEFFERLKQGFLDRAAPKIVAPRDQRELDEREARRSLPPPSRRVRICFHPSPVPLLIGDVATLEVENEECKVGCFVGDKPHPYVNEPSRSNPKCRLLSTSLPTHATRSQLKFVINDVVYIGE